MSFPEFREGLLSLSGVVYVDVRSGVIVIVINIIIVIVNVS